MRISRVQAFLCDGGWRNWVLVKVATDEGLVGWGECSDSRIPYGIVGCVRDFEDVLLGEDPRAIERLYWDMLRASRQNLGGTSHKAIAGIELALRDIKGKALGVPVYELFGGPMPDRMRLYWSHCGTTRARHAGLLGLPELRSYDDVVALGREVVERGFTALKTNIVIPGDPAQTYFAGFGRGQGSTAPRAWSKSGGCSSASTCSGSSTTPGTLLLYYRSRNRFRTASPRAKVLSARASTDRSSSCTRPTRASSTCPV